MLNFFKRPVPSWAPPHTIQLFCTCFPENPSLEILVLFSLVLLRWVALFHYFTFFSGSAVVRICRMKHSNQSFLTMYIQVLRVEGKTPFESVLPFFNACFLVTYIFIFFLFSWCDTWHFCCKLYNEPTLKTQNILAYKSTFKRQLHKATVGM